jgi:hypothetical protein
LAQFSPSFGRINPSGASGLHMPTESPQRLNPQTPIQTIQPESLEFSSGQMLPGEQDAWQAQQNEK